MEKSTAYLVFLVTVITLVCAFIVFQSPGVVVVPPPIVETFVPKRLPGNLNSIFRGQLDPFIEFVTKTALSSDPVDDHFVPIHVINNTMLFRDGIRVVISFFNTRESFKLDYVQTPDFLNQLVVLNWYMHKNNLLNSKIRLEIVNTRTLNTMFDTFIDKCRPFGYILEGKKNDWNARVENFWAKNIQGDLFIRVPNTGSGRFWYNLSARTAVAHDILERPEGYYSTPLFAYFTGYVAAA